MTNSEFEITNVIDEIDESGHPVCTIHYRRGVSENFISIDGPSSNLDMDLVQKNIIEDFRPTNPEFAVGYHFQGVDWFNTIDECNDILFKYRIIGDDFLPEKKVLANFEQEKPTNAKKSLGNTGRLK